MGLKLNGTHKLLPHADDVILLGNNMDTIKNAVSSPECCWKSGPKTAKRLYKNLSPSDIWEGQ
jgi:hypothetical protein